MKRYIKILISFSGSIVTLLLFLRFTFLLFPLCFYIDRKSFFIIIIGTILLDIIISVGIHFYDSFMGTSSMIKNVSLYTHGEKTEEVNNILTENILSYFKSTYFNIKKRLEDKTFFVIKCPYLYGCLKSFPDSYESVILVPDTFDESYPRDIVLLSHEYSHCMLHNLFTIQDKQRLLLAFITLIISLCFVYTGGSLWYLGWAFFFVIYVFSSIYLWFIRHFE